MKKGIIHIGIWHGYEIENYAKQGYTQALLFEPNPESYKICLDKMIHVNNMYNTDYKCYQTAITDEDDKEIDFYIIKRNHGSSSILAPSDVWNSPRRLKRTGGFQRIIKVKTKRMAQLIKKESINLNNFKRLVIDVQGAEMYVLKSFDDYISNFDSIRIEVTKDNWKDAQYIGGCWFSEVNKFLTLKGYELITKEYWEDNWFHGDVEYIKNG